MPASPDPPPPADAPVAAPVGCAPASVRLVPAREGVEVSWSPVPGAEGYELELLAADGSPLRPAPGFALRECGATVDTSALPAGAGLRVRVRALGPFSEAAVLPAAPAAPTVRRAGDAVRVEWAEVDGATGYDLHLLDAEGRLLSPQPPLAVEGAAATVPVGALEPGGSYGVRLRVLAGESLGPWSPPAAVALDEPSADAPGDEAVAGTTGGASPEGSAEGGPGDAAPAADAEPVAAPPDEPEVELQPPLGPLRERLRAAGGEVVLTAELLGDAELVRRLGILLGLDAAGLSLQAARLASDDASVTLTGEATLFGRPTVETALRFAADAGDGLRLALHAALGDLMLGDLYAGEVLQEPPFDTGEWRSLALPEMTLELDPAAGEARLVGEPSPEPWEVVGLDDVALGPVSADLRIRVGSDGLRQVEPTAATLLTVGDLPLPATLELPHSLRGWSLRLADAGPVPLDEVDALSPLLGGTGAGLPRTLRAVTPLALAALDLSWTPLHPGEWDLWLELVASDDAQGGAALDDGEAQDGEDGGAVVWRLDGGLVLADPAATIGIALRPVDGERRAIPSGSIQGTVALGSERVPAVVDLPADEGPYRLRLLPAGELEPAAAASLPGLEGLVLAELLAPLGSFPELALQLAEVALVPGEAAADGVQLVLRATRKSGEDDSTPAESVSLTVEFASAALDGPRPVAVTIVPAAGLSDSAPVETAVVTWPSASSEGDVTRSEIKSVEPPSDVAEPTEGIADDASSADQPVELANEVGSATSSPDAGDETDEEIEPEAEGGPEAAIAPNQEPAAGTPELTEPVPPADADDDRSASTVGVESEEPADAVPSVADAVEVPTEIAEPRGEGVGEADGSTAPEDIVSPAAAEPDEPAVSADAVPAEASIGAPEAAAADADGSEAAPGEEQPDSASAADDAAGGIPVPGEVRAIFLSALSRLVAEWQPVEGATAYHAQLVDATGEPLDPTSAYAFTDARGGIDAGDLAHGLEHGLRVRAVAGDEAGAWSPAAAFTPAALPAPEGLRLEPGEGGVRATWSAAGGAADYEVQALGGDGRVLDPAPRVEVSGTTARIEESGEADAAVARVRVRARAAGSAGPWAVSALLPARAVPAPAWQGEEARADEPAAAVPAVLGPDPDDGAG